MWWMRHTSGTAPLYLYPPPRSSTRSMFPRTSRPTVCLLMLFSIDATPLDTIIQRLQTIRLTGANVLELHGIEQSSCDQQYDICWKDPSYSPGLLRPTIGNNRKLKELIDRAHQLNMSVVIDLDWESFNVNSVIFHYHQFYRLCCSEFVASLLDQLEVGDSLKSSDVFREAEDCEDRCALNIVDNQFILLLLRSVFHQYRHDFHIDGIRWINNRCDMFVGGNCTDGGTYSDRFSNAINDLWTDLRSEGFAIVHLLVRSNL